MKAVHPHDLVESILSSCNGKTPLYCLIIYPDEETVYIASHPISQQEAKAFMREKLRETDPKYLSYLESIWEIVNTR